MFVSIGFVLLLYYFAPRLHYDDDDYRVITFCFGYNRRAFRTYSSSYCSVYKINQARKSLFS